MEIITSKNNSLIKKYKKLKNSKYRKQMQLFIVEGKNIVEEARKKNLLKVVFTSDPNERGILVSKQIFASLCTTKTPVTTIGICKIVAKKLSGKRILALDNIQDPGNLGTLIRTAKAFGWDSVLINGVDQYNPKVVRATQGALFGINVVQTNDIAQHFANYKVIVATTSKVSFDVVPFNAIKNIPNQLMLVLGNEGHGVSQKVLNKADYKVTIPMQFESLNVAQAGAILLNEYQK